MQEIKEEYFKKDTEFREWLALNYNQEKGVYLIFYTVAHENESMRWEEAVRVALCYGWIDSKVQSLGDGKRRQYFCPRKAKSVWSKVNKDHIIELKKAKLMHESGLQSIAIAKENGSWTAMDDVEKGIIPDDLKAAFNTNKKAFANYSSFSPSQRKSYLFWLKQAKREATRVKRITEIIALCTNNIKSRTTR